MNDRDIMKRRNALMLLGDQGEEPVYEEDAGFPQDDFDRAVQTANRFPGDVSGLLGKSSIRSQKWQALVETAPFSRPQPPTALKGTLGGQQLITSEPSRLIANSNILAGPPIQLVNWAGDDDAETVPITVTIAPVQQPSDKTQPYPLRPYAIVTFGTRGFSPQAEVDINTGCEFTVSGSAITVQAALELPFGGLPAGVIENQTLLAMLSYYPIVKANSATRTRYIDNADTSAQNTIIIPPFSKTVRILPNDAVNAGTTSFVFFDSAQLAPIAGGTIALTTNGFYPDIPIPDDAYVMRITSTQAGKQFRAIFNLSF